MSSMKGLVAKVNLGFTVIEGIMLPDGSYGIAVPQLAELFSFTPNYASQTLKRLLGEDFRPHKVSTELGNQKVNVVLLPDVKKVIRALDKKGNPVASAFTDAMLEEGLERRFDTGFNQRVEEEERNQRVALRMKRLLARHEWTDVLMERHLQQTGQKPLPEQYRKWTVRVNEVLFNKPHFNRNRDNMNMNEQRTIEQFEAMATRMAKKYPTANCDELIGKVLDTF